MLHTQDKKSILTQGIVIFVYLAILTGLEFLVAISFSAVPLLVVFALVKAALVVYYYMHIYKLSVEHEEENIEVLELDINKAMTMMQTGEIRDGKTIMLLQYVKLNQIL